MSAFLPFGNATSRFTCKAFEEIVPAERVPIVLEMAGFFANRTAIQIRRLKPILAQISATLPLVESGPQYTLNTLYNNISSISGILSQSGQEQDKKMPAELHVSELISEAFSYLGQFHPYLKSLVSPTECTKMASYIPALLDCVKTVTDTFDKILEMIPECEKAILPQARVPTEYGHLAAAIITVVEECVVDVNFLMQSEGVVNAKEKLAMLQQWMVHLAQYVCNVFAKARSVKSLVAMTSSFIAITPSLMSVLNQVEDLITDKAQFSLVAEHAVTLMQLVNSLDATTWSVYIKDVAATIADVYSGKGNVAQLAEDTTKIMQMFEERFQENPTKEAELTKATCTAIISYYPTNNKLIAMAATAVIRSFAVSANNTATAETILIVLVQEMAKIAATILADVHALSKETTDLYMGYLALFDDELLNTINYYTNNILRVTELNAEDPEFLFKLDRVSSWFGSIEPSIRRMIASSSDAEVIRRCNAMIEKLQPVANEFCKWTEEIFLCLSAVMTERGGSTDYVFEFLRASHEAIPSNIDEKSKMVQPIVENLLNKYLIMDMVPVCELVTILSDLKEPVADYLQASKSADASSHLKCGALAFPEIIRPFPSLIEHLKKLAHMAADNDTFVPLMTSIITQAPLLMDEGLALSNDHIECMAFLMAKPVSLLLRAVGMMTGTSFEGYRDNLRQAIDTIWSIAVNCMNGTKPPEFESLGNFVSSLKQMLKNLELAVAKLPQPAEECAIPETLKEIKAFENQTIGLSGILQKIAIKLVGSLKGLPNDDVREFLKVWFTKALEASSIGFDQAYSMFKTSGLQYVLSKDGNRASVMTAFAPFSVALALAEFGEPWNTHIRNFHDELLDLVKKVMESEENWEQYVREMMAIGEGIMTVKQIVQNNTEGNTSLLLETLGKLLPVMHRIRLNNANPALSDLCESGMNLKSLEVILLALNQHEELAGVISDASTMFLTTKIDVSSLNTDIQKLAAKMRSLQGVDILKVRTIVDIDTLLEIIYNQLSIYRDCTARVLDTTDTTEREFMNLVSSMTSVSCVGASVALQCLDLSKLKVTPLAGSYLNAFTEILTSLGQFIPHIEKLKGDNSDNLELRRLSRRIAKDFDDLIDMMEVPPTQTPPADDFESLRINFLAKLADVSNNIGKLSWASVNSFVPEMFDADYAKISTSMTSAMKEMQDAAASYAAKAVGSTKDDFEKLVSSLDTQVKKLMKTAETINFCESFSAKMIVTEAESTSNTVAQIVELAHALLDHVVIAPDPESAAKLGDDFDLPPPPDAVPLDVAYSEYQKSSKVFSDSINSLKGVLQQSLAQGTTIVGSFNLVNTAVNNFAISVMKVSIATPDARLQVELQTSLHTFADTFSSLKDAIRSRLMRAPRFEAEIEDALSALLSALLKMNQLAEASSKAEKPTAVIDDANEDNVTRELKASANAIEEMAARLQQFSAQLGAPAETETVAAQIDLEAEKGTLPAFVIANANPILIAAGQILKRSQQITADQIAQFGKVENEQLLIRCAKEVSEAAALLLICAEILIAGDDNDADFKTITAAKIIKAAVASLVAQVLVKGGDSEGIMNQHVKVVVFHTDKIITKLESIVLEKMNESEAKNKRGGNKLIMKLNLQNRINNVRTQLQDQERVLYQFRKRSWSGKP